MPVQFEIKDDVSGEFITLGEVEFDQGIKTLTHGIEEMKKRSIEYMLFDLRKGEERRTAEELKQIALYIMHFLQKGKVALVVPSDLYFGLSRMMTAHLDTEQVKAFVSMDYDEAVNWLLTPLGDS